MPRPFLFGTNLKMNQTAAESARFYEALTRTPPPPDVRLFVAPPFTSLPTVSELKRATGAPIWVGAQNVHWASEGAYTGEISASMLSALGVDLVLVGHAERRGHGKETDDVLNEKVLAALGAGLRVLLCVGETAEEKAYGVGPETVARQLKIDLHDVGPPLLPGLQIAYEPVWSVGAGGTPARPEDVAPIAAYLRTTLVDRFGDAGRDLPILYGGSVDSGNAGTFARLPEIGGLLVGRAGWTVEGYRAVLAAAMAARHHDNEDG